MKSRKKNTCSVFYSKKALKITSAPEKMTFFFEKNNV